MNVLLACGAFANLLVMGAMTWAPNAFNAADLAALGAILGIPLCATILPTIAAFAAFNAGRALFRGGPVGPVRLGAFAAVIGAVSAGFGAIAHVLTLGFLAVFSLLPTAVISLIGAGSGIATLLALRDLVVGDERELT